MDIAIAILAIMLATCGTLLTLIAAVGLIRLPDAYLRCHAAGKAATLGVVFILVAAALILGSFGAWTRSLLAAVLLIATVPVATQLLARGAATAGITPDPDTRDYTD